MWQGRLSSHPLKDLLRFTHSWEALVDRSYAIWSGTYCNLKLDILHRQMGTHCSCIGIFYLGGWCSAPLWGNLLGIWAAVAANAVALLSCILFHCPRLPAQAESPGEGDLHPGAQQGKAQPAAVRKPHSCVSRVPCSLKHPLTPSTAQSLEHMVTNFWVGAQAQSSRISSINYPLAS